MQENQIKTILGFYDQNEEFLKNDKYSDRYQSVYTKQDDNSHWLVAIPHDNNRLEIHQTDEHGVIITRDTYESKGNTVSCLSVERLQEDSKRMVSFSADEINLIYQFGESGKTGLLAMLNEILPRIKDTDTSRTVSLTIDKLSSLSPKVCTMLISSTKCRKLYERDHSIRERIAKAKEQLKYPTTDEQKNKRENHVKRGEHSL